jgi:hypothetical protein
MFQFNTLLHVFKTLIPENEIYDILESYGYTDSAMKWKAEDQLSFWLLASSNQWKNYRHSENELAFGTRNWSLPFETVRMPPFRILIPFMTTKSHLSLSQEVDVYTKTTIFTALGT